jgi:tetratricopeptide (TPR) repeat protein
MRRFLLSVAFVSIWLLQSAAHAENSANLAAQAAKKILKGDFHGAIDDATRSLALHPNAKAYFERGSAEYYLGSFKSAIKDLDEAIRLDPGNSDSYMERSDFYMERAESKSSLGDFIGSIPDYNEAVRIDPRNSSAYILRGDTKLSVNDLNGALSDFNDALKALSIDTKGAEVIHKNRDALLGCKDALKASDNAEKVLKEPKLRAIAYFGRGTAKAKLHDYKQAIDDLDSSIQIDPTNALAFLNRGLAKHSLTDNKGAIVDFNRAISLDPQNASTYKNRARVKLALGDTEGAAADIAKVKQLEPK